MGQLRKLAISHFLAIIDGGLFCRGYRVQFHVIETSFLGDVAAIDREFTHPFGKFSPSSVEYAQVSPKALTFQIPYKGNYLPSYIQIGSDLLSGALKNGVLYRVITVAYTKVSSTNHATIKAAHFIVTM